MLAFQIVLFCFFLVFESGGAVAEAPPDLRLLSERPVWLRLGHYKKSTWKSEIDGGGFFLSQEGKTSPLAELVATWKALTENKQIQISTPWGNFEGLARCFFPARAKLLEKETGHTFPRPVCKDFETWIKKISGQSVSLIFSSYYNGAPASMFGHSFLRISRTRSDSGEPGNPLLDLAIDFSAQTRAENKIVEALKGLFGFYPGRYGILPYYVKVKEYNNAENRDLFEYPLNFTSEETDTLLSHIWELSYSYSDYYFLHRNCSYQLLKALEVAKPEWNMSEYRVFAVPVDTIRDVLRQPHSSVASRATYRKSLATRLKNTYDALSESDQKAYRKFTKGDRLNEPFAHEIQSTALMDAIATHFLVLQMEHRGELPTQLSQRHRELLARRASVGGTKSIDQEKEQVISPDLGHPTSRIQLGTSLSRQRPTAVTLSWRPALHDLLSEDAGYNAFSRLEIFSTELSYRPETKYFALERLTALGITSLNPVHPTQPKWSYVWDLYGEEARGLQCTECTLFGLIVGLGKTLSFPTTESGVVYSMLVVDAQLASALQKGWRTGPGLRLGGVWNLWERGKFQLQETLQYWMLDHGRVTSSLEAGLRVFPNWDERRSWEMSVMATALSSLLGPKGSDQTFRFGLGYSF